MLKEPQCSKRNCKNYLGIHDDGSEATERNFCKAFPNKIPVNIAYGKNLHLLPVAGDHGTQYEKADK